MSDAAAPILTPDQRLRVFISSRLSELAPEREAVAAAVRTLRLTPVRFELGARAHRPDEVYSSLQSGVDLGRRLGLGDGRARQLMRQQLVENELRGVDSLAYRVGPDCRDGGTLDLDPARITFL